MPGGTMHSQPLPAGHPGDFAYRLALVRLLSSRARVTKEQVDAATHSSKRGGLFVSHLLDAGVNPDHLLNALASATGLPNAPRSEVRHPGKQVAQGLDPELCHALLAVPFKLQGAELHIAFVAPLPAQLTAALPRHTAWVCLEDDVRAGLMSLWPRKVAHAPVAAPAAAPAAVATPASAAVGAPAQPSTTVDPAAPPAAAAPAPAFFAPPPQRPADPLDPLALVDKPAVAQAPEAPAPTTATPAAAATLTQPGLTEFAAGPEPREVLLATLKQYRVHAALGAAGLLAVAGVIAFINHSRSEVERKGAQLGVGLRAAARDSARARVAEQGGAPYVGAEPAAGGESIEGAIVRVDAAADDDSAFPEACHALAEATRAASLSAPTVMQQSDLRNLSIEVTVLCESEGSPGQDRWKELRARLTRVLAGDNPKPGPRYQVDAPAEVTSAAAAVDAALQAGDVEQSCAAMSSWRHALIGWSEKFPPGARMMRMMEVIDRDWELFNCSQLSIEAIRGTWAGFQRKVAPEP